MKATMAPVPICAKQGIGSEVWDVDGNRYLDFTLSFGPMLLGQSPKVVGDAVRSQLDLGIGFGAGNCHEAPLAEIICEIVPSADLVIFSNSGTEAVQAAIRVARAATGRQTVIKFRGHYHGWLDSMHVAIPGVAGDTPGTSGQDPSAARQTIVCDWNDLESLASALSNDIAAVIMEPINVNGGCFVADPGYLEEVRRMTTAAGVTLIFDEVITGFRSSLGGAQELLGVKPDITILGKALGSGLPISAVCGSREVMDEVASGRVAHMGNLNGSPLSAAAALATLTYLKEHSAEIYPKLQMSMETIDAAFKLVRDDFGLPLQFNWTVGAGFAFVSDQPVRTHDERLNADVGRYGQFASRLLDEGLFVPARGLWYVSTEHSKDDLDVATEKIGSVASTMFRELAEDQS